MKHVLMIVNPTSGKNSKRIKPADVVRTFNSHDFDCFEKTTTCRGDAVEIAKKYAKDYDAVVCCGGDGTYNEVITGIMRAEAETPIIYLPCGSTNDFAESVGIKNDIETTVQMFVDNKMNRFDVGKFNDKYFGYVAAFGLGTSFSYNTSQKFKNKLGHAAYIIDGFFLNIVPVLKNIKPYYMTIEYDDGVITDNFYFGAVANTNKVAGLFNLDHCDIKMNDGVFEVVLVRGMNIKNVGSIFFKALRQAYPCKEIMVLKTKKLKITAPDGVEWTLDGEYGGSYTEIEIENLHKAITLISPESRFL